MTNFIWEARLKFLTLVAERTQEKGQVVGARGEDDEARHSGLLPGHGREAVAEDFLSPGVSG